jgi:Superinfection immunity protein
VISALVNLVVLTDLTCMSVVLYMLPSVIGWIRRARNTGTIAVVNILLGWTLIGWVAALVMALRAARTPDPPQCVPPARASWPAGPGGPPAPRPGSPPPLRLPPRRPPESHHDAGHG